VHAEGYTHRGGVAQGPQAGFKPADYCEVNGVCRNIKTLYNFEPPATGDEIRAAAQQFVRKITGFAVPSAANQDAFDRAVTEIVDASSALLGSLVTAAPPRNREVEAAKAHARAIRRFGSRA
jgi:hypothetical protein